eukprot:1141102-Pelagomonas_calceolata.AAC.1
MRAFVCMHIAGACCCAAKVGSSSQPLRALALNMTTQTPTHTYTNMPKAGSSSQPLRALALSVTSRLSRPSQDSHSTNLSQGSHLLTQEELYLVADEWGEGMSGKQPSPPPLQPSQQQQQQQQRQLRLLHSQESCSFNRWGLQHSTGSAENQKPHSNDAAVQSASCSTEAKRGEAWPSSKF